MIRTGSSQKCARLSERQGALSACRKVSQLVSMIDGCRVGIAPRARAGGLGSRITLALQDESVELSAIRTDHAARIVGTVEESVSRTAHRRDRCPDETDELWVSWRSASVDLR